MVNSTNANDPAVLFTPAEVAALLNKLADGRAYYAHGYPEGDALTYLETQTATLETVARIFSDLDGPNAALFLPTHMLDQWTELLAGNPTTNGDEP